MIIKLSLSSNHTDYYWTTNQFVYDAYFATFSSTSSDSISSFSHSSRPRSQSPPAHYSIALRILMNCFILMTNWFRMFGSGPSSPCIVASASLCFY